MKAPFNEVISGFVSLLTGMGITLGQLFRPIVTVQYPHQTLTMPKRFRGHILLKKEPTTGKSTCVACDLCVKACPSDCILVEGEKKPGEKRKSVTLFELDYTKCSLCGACVEVCPVDALEYSRAYNLASTSKQEYKVMDLVKRLEDSKHP
ncbi:MAG: NADH-quinone oxidoreductase subunit I [Verrucomicrobia bacterium]|nr:NADH-quinone oxidoreductase subunit I [Verrucomicrobiota bacterium]